MKKILLRPGELFGRLVVVREFGGGRWVCRCDCGAERIVRASALKSGGSRSCGCLKADLAGAKEFRHGHNAAQSRTYCSWRAMIQRCTNSNTQKWHLYGGRGISVCARWRCFENFLADMGERPTGKTLDRWPDRDGDYEPGNCRWATPAEQSNNSRRWTAHTKEERSNV